jgi:hypothetical protein
LTLKFKQSKWLLISHVELFKSFLDMLALLQLQCLQCLFLSISIPCRICTLFGNPGFPTLLFFLNAAVHTDTLFGKKQVTVLRKRGPAVANQLRSLLTKLQCAKLLSAVAPEGG